MTGSATMPRSKDVCAACSAPTARQPFVVACGKCLRQFHCKCVGIKDEDHDLVVGTFKCFACTRRHDPESAAVLGGGTAGTPAVVVRGPHHRQPEVAPPAGDSDLIQVVRLLCRKVDAVAADVRSLKDDNASLLERLVEQDAEGQNLAAQSKKGLLCPKIDGTSAELCPLNNVNEVLCCQLARKDAGERRLAPGGGCKGVVCVGQRDGACTGDDCELFQQVALLRRDVDALASDVRLLNSESELFRLHLARTTEVLGNPEVFQKVDVAAGCSLAWERAPTAGFCRPRPGVPARRALFVSRLHPSTTSKSVADFVDCVTGGGACVCTKLPSKHDTYASFHVAVDEPDFEGLLKAEVWPTGCLFRPFYGTIREVRCADSNIARIEKST
ncbi:hypothetical protein MTO96_027783 [Rhipicephalus appendiculatus]